MPDSALFMSLFGHFNFMHLRVRSGDFGIRLRFWRGSVRDYFTVRWETPTQLCAFEALKSHTADQSFIIWKHCSERFLNHFPQMLSLKLAADVMFSCHRTTTKVTFVRIYWHVCGWLNKFMPASCVSVSEHSVFDQFGEVSPEETLHL